MNKDLILLLVGTFLSAYFVILTIAKIIYIHNLDEFHLSLVSGSITLLVYGIIKYFG